MTKRIQPIKPTTSTVAHTSRPVAGIRSCDPYPDDLRSKTILPSLAIQKQDQDVRRDLDAVQCRTPFGDAFLETYQALRPLLAELDLPGQKNDSKSISGVKRVILAACLTFSSDPERIARLSQRGEYFCMRLLPSLGATITAHDRLQVRMAVHSPSGDQAQSALLIRSLVDGLYSRLYSRVEEKSWLDQLQAHL